MSTAPDLRSLMRLFPHGVAVATVDLEGERAGLTVSSLVSLSLEPPLVGIAVSRQAALHELLRRAGTFGLSLLAGDQEGLAQHFARGVPPIALWQGVPVRERGPGPPLLEGALGWIDGRVRSEAEAGTHTFFISEVVGAERGRGGPPLLYVGQRYRSL